MADQKDRPSTLDFTKTPAELAAETPDETAARYKIDQSVTETDEKNPRVEHTEAQFLAQVPSGTHLHPDIAKDLQNRGISAPTTDNAQIRKGDVFVGYDFADEAPVDEEDEEDKDEKDDKAVKHTSSTSSVKDSKVK